MKCQELQDMPYFELNDATKSLEYQIFQNIQLWTNKSVLFIKTEQAVEKKFSGFQCNVQHPYHSSEFTSAGV